MSLLLDVRSPTRCKKWNVQPIQSSHFSLVAQPHSRCRVTLALNRLHLLCGNLAHWSCYIQIDVFILYAVACFLFYIVLKETFEVMEICVRSVWKNILIIYCPKL